jgi:hypothetical protein
MNNNNAIQQSCVKKLSEGKYYAHKDDLYFVLERVTSENIGFWKDYSDSQAELSKGNGILGTLRHTSGSIFKGALNFYKDYDVWVAYSTMKDITQPDTHLNMIGDIEMCVTVSTTPDLPCSTHFGIFKSYEFIINDVIDSSVRKGTIKDKTAWENIGTPYKNLIAHKGLSLDLHSFAAKATQEIYGNKDYMITRPNETMFNIIKNNLSQELVYIVTNDFEDFDSPFLCNMGKMFFKKLSGEEVSFETPEYWYQESLGSGAMPLTVLDINKLGNKVSFDIISDAPTQQSSNIENLDNSVIESIAEKVSEIKLVKEENKDNSKEKSTTEPFEMYPEEFMIYSDSEEYEEYSSDEEDRDQYIEATYKAKALPGALEHFE